MTFLIGIMMVRKIGRTTILNTIFINILQERIIHHWDYFSSGRSGLTLGAIITVIIVFLIFGGIVNLFTPKCIVAGCDSERAEGSSYSDAEDFLL